MGKLGFGKRSWLSYDSYTLKLLPTEHLCQLTDGCVVVTDAVVHTGFLAGSVARGQGVMVLNQERGDSGWTCRRNL